MNPAHSYIQYPYRRSHNAPGWVRIAIFILPYQLRDDAFYPFDVKGVGAPDGSVKEKIVSLDATTTELRVKEMPETSFLSMMVNDSGCSTSIHKFHDRLRGYQIYEEPVAGLPYA
jgi:hypothetical protein